MMTGDRSQADPWRRPEAPPPTGALFRTSAAGLGLKVLYAGLTLGLTIVLARTLGPSGYGTYAFVLALVSLLAIPAQAGLPHLVVRETAKAQTDEAWDLIAGLWRWTALATGGLALLLIIAAGAAVLIGVGPTDVTFLSTLGWGLLLVPLVALVNLHGAALRGLRHVVHGQIPEMVLRPGLFLCLLGLVLLVNRAALTPVNAMAAHAVSAGVALIGAAFLLRRAAPAQIRASTNRTFATKEWLSSAIPLALIAGMQVVNAHTDVVMLGLFTPPEDVGVYRVTVQGAALVSFGLQAVNMVASPDMARLHVMRDKPGLQRVATRTARLALLVAVPSVLVLVLFGAPLLEAFFGGEFRRGAPSLAILALGQLINSTFGSVGVLLNMTGHERDTARGVAVAALANVALNLILIPMFGMIGAAIATVVTFGLWNVLLWRSVRGRLGVNSLAVGRR